MLISHIPMQFSFPLHAFANNEMIIMEVMVLFNNVLMTFAHQEVWSTM